MEIAYRLPRLAKHGNSIGFSANDISINVAVKARHDAGKGTPYNPPL